MYAFVIINNIWVFILQNDWVLCKIFKYSRRTKRNDSDNEIDEAIVSVMDVETPMSIALYSPSHNTVGNWLPGQHIMNMSQSDHSINQSTVSGLADDHPDHDHQPATNYYVCLDDESLSEATTDMLDCVDFSALFDNELKYFDPPFAIPESSAAEYFDSLPPGFLFSPSDKELVVDYLRKKISNRPLPINRIHVVDLYKYNPQQLTSMSN